MTSSLMPETEAELYFMRIKWPSGYHCPRCGFTLNYVIHTRRLPLYQCRACRHQTTLLSGTIMKKSRTPLSKWAAALQLMSETKSVNAVQLAKIIRVIYKTAWLMLHKIRKAISAASMLQPLCDTVRVRLLFYGSPNLQPYVRHPQEHPVLVAEGETKSGNPSFMKIVRIPLRDMNQKSLLPAGEARFVLQHIHDNAAYSGLLPRFRLREEPILWDTFRQARTWLNRTFHGIGAKYQQSYWDEFCFRRNFSFQGVSILHVLTAFCVTKGQYKPAYIPLGYSA